MQQDEALTILKMGKNVFLTGAAGAGKTYVLNKYIHYLKENNVVVAVTASTGVAATHLQGTTIHSWSGMGVRDNLTFADLEKIQKTKRIVSNYKKTKVLIIDEVSMLHKHQLDMVDTIARHILVSDKMFGGMQVVLCGDFFQLPPVSSGSFSNEKEFAYEAVSWIEGNFNVCYLHEQHRQNDDPLLDILNDIRSGTAGERTKVPLRTRYKKEPEGETKPTKLYTRNINVDAINEKALDNTPGPEKVFTMKSVGFSALVEGLKKSCLALETLKLKIGAEVMFIKNDVASRYVNGTRCVVVGFSKEEGLPIVKTHDNEVFVVFPETWKYEDNGSVKATISQIPLRLAWAITIHKSQGMTLDAAEIDLGDAFEPGMGYVALSRVRRLNGLKLMNLNEMALKVHPKILLQDQFFKNNSDEQVNLLQEYTEEEIDELCESTLIERWGGNKTKVIKKKKVKEKKALAVLTHITTLEMLKENLSLESIAEQRGFSIRTIMSHLEKLHGLNLMDDVLLNRLKNNIPKEDFEIIFAEFLNSPDGKLKPIYEHFAEKYSYEMLQIVRLFVTAQVE